jgi:predicted TIM-barrel fold metal-dependent hydrolase
VTATERRQTTGREANAAFEAARRLGVVDTMISFPLPKEETFKTYEFIRRQTRDAESRTGEGGLAFPAGYMFKEVPQYSDEELDDPVRFLVAEMDRFGIACAMIGVPDTSASGPSRDNYSARALREFPDRFCCGVGVDPNEGMEALRKIDRAKERYDIKAVHAFPSGLYPQVALNDKMFYPVYMKCIELDVAFCSTAGVPGPRLRFAPQHVELIDEICWFFPELRFVTRHGCQPWEELAVKLLLKWPNLYYSTTAFAPRYYPPAIIDFANTRGADKVMYSGYYPMGLSLDRIFDELPHVPLRDHVWPKFLRDTAIRAFKLDLPTSEELAAT